MQYPTAAGQPSVQIISHRRCVVLLFNFNQHWSVRTGLFRQYPVFCPVPVKSFFISLHLLLNCLPGVLTSQIFFELKVKSLWTSFAARLKLAAAFFDSLSLIISYFWRVCNIFYNLCIIYQVYIVIFLFIMPIHLLSYFPASPCSAGHSHIPQQPSFQSLPFDLHTHSRWNPGSQSAFQLLFCPSSSRQYSRWHSRYTH